MIWPLSAAVLLVSGALLIQSQPDQFDATDRSHRELGNLKVYDAAWSLVDRHYYDRDANRQAWKRAGAEYRPKAARADTQLELYWTVLHPMMQTLGTSHAVAMPADLPSAKAAPSAPAAPPVLTKQPATGETPWRGIGFTFTFDAKGMHVTSVEPGSPLQKAGIGPGALLLEMHIDPPRDGLARFQGRFKVAQLAPQQVDFRFKAKPGGTQREARRLRRGGLYLRFDRFDHDSVGWVVSNLRTAGHGPVILDLRQNVGGSTEELRLLAGVLFDRDLAIGYRVAGGKTPVNARSQGTAYSGPLALLVGSGTASAAEVLSDAVLHYKRGLVVGGKTQGAVVEAKFFPLPDGGRLQIPINDFLGASGQRLEATGVEPSIPVILDGRSSDRDLVLEKAEELLGAR